MTIDCDFAEGPTTNVWGIALTTMSGRLPDSLIPLGYCSLVKSHSKV